jgi:3-isopropylmalate dehydrogenase
MKAEADEVVRAVDEALKAGYRTRDIADAETPNDKILGTDGMGKQILGYLNSVTENQMV